jgi:hypothetical protein
MNSGGSIQEDLPKYLNLINKIAGGNVRKLFLLILGLFLATNILQAQIEIIFSFANGEVIIEGENSYYEFDVMAAASSEGTRLGTGIVLINYNTAAFGTWAQTSGNSVATKGTLIDSPSYNLYHADNSSSRVAYTFEYPLSEGFGTLLPTTPTQLLHLRLTIADTDETAGLSFDSLMEDQQYYDDNSTLYDPVSFDNDDDSPLPVILSTFTVTYLDGEGLINWTTQSENNTQGWNIYRAISSNYGQSMQVNPTLIPAAGFSSSPVNYNWIDNSIVEYIDNYGLSDEIIFWYWLESIELDGSSVVFQSYQLVITESEFNIEPPSIPGRYGLYANYPNPFNPSTEFSFSLPEDSECELTVFNVKGRKVKTIYRGRVEAERAYNFVWDTRDRGDNITTSGIYFYQLIVNGRVADVKKCLLLK